MSLRETIERFAEQQRASVMEQQSSRQSADTVEVKWQGYNSDGIPIVRNNDKVQTANGQGHISKRGNSSMILDQAGSVEYQKRNRQRQDRYQKQSSRPKQKTETTPFTYASIITFPG